MIMIKVYTSKKFTDTKNAFGVVNIIRDNEILGSNVVVLNGPTTVGTATYALALAALRSIGNVSEDVVFKSNKNYLNSRLAVEDDQWANGSTGSSYLFMLRQAIEERELSFSTEPLNDDDVKLYTKMLTNAKKKLKDGMEKRSKISTDQS